MFISGVLGFVGFAFGMIFMLIHLVSLESFGTPYLSPIAPFDGFKRNINLLIYHILPGFVQLSVYLHFVICNDFPVMLNHLTVVVFRVKREFRDELTCFFS
ncbi:hypothetical protein CPT76_09370 [Paenibacillus sp. AR247]|nr:hypothetical protein CPT76_09370 [Paenibacillus sp. AR247]